MRLNIVILINTFHKVFIKKLNSAICFTFIDIQILKVIIFKICI